jgi:hypothetical protein
MQPYWHLKALKKSRHDFCGAVHQEMLKAIQISENHRRSHQGQQGGILRLLRHAPAQGWRGRRR